MLINSSNHLFELAREGELRLSGWPARLYPLLAVLYGLFSPLLGSVFAAIPVGILIFLMGRDTFETGGLYSSAFGLTAILILGFGPIYFLIRFWLYVFERRSLWTLGLESQGWLSRYLRGGGWGLVMICISMGVPALLGFSTYDVGGGSLLWMVGTALGVLLGWIIQGGAEELLFRGFIFQTIGVRFGMLSGILVSSLLFALLHIFNQDVNLLAMANLTLFGVFSCLYAAREGSLWGVFALHSAWNWAQANLFGVQVSGVPVRLDTILKIREAGPAWLVGGGFGPEGGVVVTVVLLVGIAVLLSRAK